MSLGRKLRFRYYQLTGHSSRGLAFFHLPKCGGTSVFRSLQRHFPAERQFVMESNASKDAADLLGMPLWDYRLAVTVGELSKCSRYRLMAGHLPCNPAVLARWRSDWMCMTILREPVDRWLSHYYYDFGRDNRFRIDMPIEEYVDTPEAGVLGRFMTDQLSAGCGSDTPADCLAAAKRSLDLMHVVGLTDDMSTLSLDFERSFGRSLSIGHLNRGRQRSTGVPSLTPSLLSRIESLCAVDLALFDHARSSMCRENRL